MNYHKFIHVAKRIIELGPRASLSVIKNRIHTQKIYAAHKRAALNGRAAHTWQRIAAMHTAQESFTSFMWQLPPSRKATEDRSSAYSFIDFLWRLRFMSDQTFPVSLLRPFANDVQVVEKADRFVAQEFDLLGSGPVRFVHHIPWHEDFRLREQSGALGGVNDCIFDKNQFYKDITISAGEGEGFAKDIKVPWELSRCYHFSVFGQAYQMTCDKTYIDAFVSQATSWMDENLYLLGANWVCPMEVGIRAINWVCAFYYFKDALRVTDDFWQRFVCTLYDHLVYLENNWEIYDSRTSNHYLSDLVGYYALCCFFSPLSGVEQKRVWCAQEIMRECDKQIFAEGADYEGSTAYHGLVAELFFVFCEFHKKHEHVDTQNLSVQLSSMMEFVAWCTPQSSDRVITVGDNDSGRVLFYGVPKELVCVASKQAIGVRYFQEFGLSVIKTKKHHLTLRHHVYSRRQPSGHFHNDAGSVTLAIDGIPVIIDPGSFVYTPSALWRNRFRSIDVHNTCFLAGIEPVDLEEHLFGLPLPECEPIDLESFGHIEVVHHLYEHQGVMLSRRMDFDDVSGCVTIVDAWLPSKEFVAGQNLLSAWNFTLAPGIEISMCNRGWQLSNGEHVLAVIKSDELEFIPQEAWFSPQYGVKIRTTALRAKAPLAPGKQYSIVIAQ